MLKQKIEEILNRQINRESYSAHLYLAMASWAENSGFEGMSKWLYAQADEERLHMLKFVAFVNERGGKAKLGAIEMPPDEFENPKKLFSEVLQHEEYITESINEIVATCYDQKDFTTLNWIQWFVNEQIEEEKNVRTILDKLNLLGDNNLYLFDKDIFGMRQIAATPQNPTE